MLIFSALEIHYGKQEPFQCLIPNIFLSFLCIINILQVTILICKFFLIKFFCARFSISLFLLIFKSNTFGWANVLFLPYLQRCFFFVPLLCFQKLICYITSKKKKRYYSNIWNLSIWELSSNMKNSTLWNMSSIEEKKKKLNSGFFSMVRLELSFGTRILGT